MTGKTNKNITYGTKDLLNEEDFYPENVKIRITTFIDLDIYEALKTKAAQDGVKYQSLLNQILRKNIIQKESKSEITIEEGKLRQIIREELKKLA